MKKILLFTMVGLLYSIVGVQAQTLVGAELLGEATGQFGQSVAISADGTRIAVSEHNMVPSKVKVYDLVAGSWSLVKTFSAADVGDNSGFGADIAMSSDGTRIIIGSMLSGTGASFPFQSGKAYVYEESGGVWSLVGSALSGSAPYDYFGSAVGMSADGTRIVVGAYRGPSSSFAGYVRVYEESGGVWNLLGTQLTGNAGDNFGWKLTISGDGTTIGVGAYGASTGSLSQNGYAKVYRLSGGSWGQLGNTFEGSADSEKLGTGIALSHDGSRLAFSKQGVSNVPVYDYDGSAWTAVGSPLSMPTRAVMAFSATGKQIALSAQFSSGERIRFYEESGGTWTQVNSDVSGTTGGGQSWIDISSDGTRVVMGEPAYNSMQGRVRVYDFTPTALPVSYLAFSGQATASGHRLDWATGSEENNEGFQIERSRDGRTFEVIGWVGGAGTTQARMDYTYLDREPLAGVSYYRLQQVDYDGTAAHSEVVTVVRQKATSAPALFPNPVTDQLTIQHATASIVTLTNALGQPVGQWEVTHSPFTVEVSGLPRGLYTATIQLADGSTHTEMLVK